MPPHVDPTQHKRNENVDNGGSCPSTATNWRLGRLVRQLLLPPATAVIVAELVGIPLGEVD
jgi:hypothetical protein